MYATFQSAISVEVQSHRLLFSLLEELKWQLQLQAQVVTYKLTLSSYLDVNESICTSFSPMIVYLCINAGFAGVKNPLEEKLDGRHEIGVGGGVELVGEGEGEGRGCGKGRVGGLGLG